MSQIRRADLILFGLAMLIIGFSVGYLVGNPAMADNAPSKSSSKIAPDYTIARCNLWAGESSPVLPPYTATNVCITDDNSISVAP